MAMRRRARFSGSSGKNARIGARTRKRLSPAYAPPPPPSAKPFQGRSTSEDRLGILIMGMGMGTDGYSPHDAAVPMRFEVAIRMGPEHSSRQRPLVEIRQRLKIPTRSLVIMVRTSYTEIGSAPWGPPFPDRLTKNKPGTATLNCGGRAGRRNTETVTNLRG